MSARQVELPHGEVGVVFRGAPPRIRMILDDSPIKGMLQEGQYVQRLLVPDFGAEVTHFNNCKVLVDYVKRFPNVRRILLLAQEPLTHIPLTLTIKVGIPPGKIGLVFEGSWGTTIKTITKEFPLNDLVEVGDRLQAILIPGHPDLDAAFMHAPNVESVLLESATLEGRSLVFTKSHQRLSPLPEAVALPVAPMYIDPSLEA